MVNLLKPQFNERKRISPFQFQAMIRKKNMEAYIQSFERMLEKYEEGLRLNPDSHFYKGLIKNTRDYLEELYSEVKLEEPSGLATKPLV
jgi:hypothetical protein